MTQDFGRFPRAIRSLAALAALACSAVAGAVTPDQVVAHHMSAFTVNDMNQIVSDYADDAILILPNEVRQGRKAIFDFFAPQRTGPNPPILSAHAKPAQGSVVVAPWTLGAGTARALQGTDIFVIRGGKIAVQTVYIGGAAGK